VWLSRVGRVVAAGLLLGVGPAPAFAAPRLVQAADPVATVIAKYRERIPELMAQQHVPGLAVALVDRTGALWVQGFGQRDDGGDPVTADTIFSVQSMSKLFTATAVMQAVEAGRLDLDAPITRYLPGFTVHSAFEQHPEQKITLRMLLSHTAGFTHEAPVGNNNDLDPGTFDAHVRSISDTWLRFPVGTGYAYSNLGVDLAGYILERVEGKLFPVLMRDSLLRPLDMDHSTFDRSVIQSTQDRAVGHVTPYPAPPVVVPMTAAGGLYTSAADLASFLRFELNDGSVDGRVVLGSTWMDEMRTVPPPNAGAPAGYALGVARTRWNRFDERPDLYDHGGSGFGFISDLWWAPQLQIGIAILTNSSDHQLQGDLALSILADLVTDPGVYHDRLLGLPQRPPITEPNWSFDPPPGMATLIAGAAMAPDGHEQTRWAAFSGPYRLPAWNVISPVGPPDRFFVEAGSPVFEAQDDAGTLVRHPLVEVQPGLFLADDGEMLDMRGQVPTWRNLQLIRVAGSPAGWQWAILVVTAVVAAAWLLAAAWRARGRHRAALASTQQPATQRRWRRTTGIVAAVTAIAVLGTVALVAALPGLVDSGFLGWLDLPMILRLTVHLPMALAALAVCTAALVTRGCVGHWWSYAVQLQYSALAITSITLAVQLAAWRLVGWGFS
jgi:CubicO group peptidase (beta-lactamase class C family)